MRVRSDHGDASVAFTGVRRGIDGCNPNGCAQQFGRKHFACDDCNACTTGTCGIFDWETGFDKKTGAGSGVHYCSDHHRQDSAGSEFSAGGYRYFAAGCGFHCHKHSRSFASIVDARIGRNIDKAKAACDCHGACNAGA
jgi:hypothetical protein